MVINIAEFRPLLNIYLFPAIMYYERLFCVKFNVDKTLTIRIFSCKILKTIFFLRIVATKNYVQNVLKNKILIKCASLTSI